MLTVMLPVKKQHEVMDHLMRAAKAAKRRVAVEARILGASKDSPIVTVLEEDFVIITVVARVLS